MADRANQKTQALVIGSRFPINVKMVPLNTPVFQIIGNESAALIWHIANPTALELDDFKYGGIKIGVSRHGKVLIFSIDQQPFAEGDSPYHAQEYNFPKDMHMMKAATDVGLPLFICVVDQNNVLRALRCINLNKAVTDFIAQTFEAQRAADGRITGAEMRNTLQAVFKKYPDTKDLMKVAAATFEIKSKKG